MHPVKHAGWLRLDQLVFAGDCGRLAAPQLRGLRVLLKRCLPAPRQQVLDAPRWVIGDAGENVSEPRFLIDTVKPRRVDKRIHYRRALPAAVGATEGPILPTYGHAALGALGCIVRHADAAVVEEARERLPTIEHV